MIHVQFNFATVRGSYPNYYLSPFSLPKTALFNAETKYKPYRRGHSNVFSDLDLKSNYLSCHELVKFAIVSTTTSRS